MIDYNKLVRDRIPEIIRAQGKECTVEVLEPATYLAKLEEKLEEELNEYRETRKVEELADLVEVALAIAEHKGVVPEAFERLRHMKNAERGAFRDRLLLVSVGG